MAKKQTPLDLLDEEYQKKRNELLVKISSEAVEKLKSLAHAFEKLPIEAQRSLFKQDDTKAIIASLGLKVGKIKNTVGKRITDDEIVEFIGADEVSVKQVQDKFNVSYQTANKRLTKLTGTKLKSRQIGVKKLYQVK